MMLLAPPGLLPAVLPTRRRMLLHLLLTWRSGLAVMQ
jgi:hypothetical protein